MASVTTNIFAGGETEGFADTAFRVLEKVARLSPTYRRVESLSQISDAELQQKGLTRYDATMQIFGSRYYA